MKAVLAGSFSPPTLGHMDIIVRASEMFDELIVAVLSQKAKTYVFSSEERLEMLRKMTVGLSNVRLVRDEGTLMDLVRREGADVILRGFRSPSDMPFEMQLAQTNRQIGGVETLFLMSSPQYSLISSTIVRDCASHGIPLETMVPEPIIEDIKKAYRCGKEEKAHG